MQNQRGLDLYQETKLLERGTGPRVVMQKYLLVFLRLNYTAVFEGFD